VMIYWLTATAGSSSQIYYEDSHLTADFIRTWGGPWPLNVPVGVANFGQDPAQPIRRWAEQLVPSLSHWTDFPLGGHFGAMERPAELVADLRAFAFDTVLREG
jgi:pimeloyl-ACP methyl ester carboxylesterase